MIMDHSPNNLYVHDDQIMNHTTESLLDEVACMIDTHMSNFDEALDDSGDGMIKHHDDDNDDLMHKGYRSESISLNKEMTAEELQFLSQFHTDVQYSQDDIGNTDVMMHNSFNTCMNNQNHFDSQYSLTCLQQSGFNTSGYYSEPQYFLNSHQFMPVPSLLHIQNRLECSGVRINGHNQGRGSTIGQVQYLTTQTETNPNSTQSMCHFNDQQFNVAYPYESQLARSNNCSTNRTIMNSSHKSQSSSSAINSNLNDNYQPLVGTQPQQDQFMSMQPVPHHSTQAGTSSYPSSVTLTSINRPKNIPYVQSNSQTQSSRQNGTATSLYAEQHEQQYYQFEPQQQIFSQVTSLLLPQNGSSQHNLHQLASNSFGTPLSSPLPMSTDIHGLTNNSKSQLIDQYPLNTLLAAKKGKPRSKTVSKRGRAKSLVNLPRQQVLEQSSGQKVPMHEHLVGVMNHQAIPQMIEEAIRHQFEIPIIYPQETPHPSSNQSRTLEIQTLMNQPILPHIPDQHFNQTNSGNSALHFQSYNQSQPQSRQHIHQQQFTLEQGDQVDWKRKQNHDLLKQIQKYKHQKVVFQSQPQSRAMPNQQKFHLQSQFQLQQPTQPDKQYHSQVVSESLVALRQSEGSSSPHYFTSASSPIGALNHGSSSHSQSDSVLQSTLQSVSPELPVPTSSSANTTQPTGSPPLGLHEARITYLVRDKSLAVKKRRKRAAALGALVVAPETPSDYSFGPIDWMFHYNALLHYASKHGHANVPVKDIYECDLPDLALDQENCYIHYKGHLGKWLARQRQLNKRVGPTQLHPEKKRLLQVLVDDGKMLWEGTTTVGKPQGGYSWETNYQALLKYCEQYGHCNVPLREEYRCQLSELDDDGSPVVYIGNLGKWLAHQRRSKRGKREKPEGKRSRKGGRTETRGGSEVEDEVEVSKLQPHREKLLQKLVDEGKLLWNAAKFSSSVKSKMQCEKSWPQNYAALLKYCEEHGKCNVPHKATYECVVEITNPDGTVSIEDYKGHLGNWLHNQRQSKKGNGFPLTAEREAMLQKLVDERKLNW